MYINSDSDDIWPPDERNNKWSDSDDDLFDDLFDDNNNYFGD